MQFIIVANDVLAPLGRKLAHALSLQKSHSGSFWTVKHYKNNEHQLDGKQPVIILGDNEISRSYVDILPEHFRGFGTKCFYEGAKAVLMAEVPEDVSREDLVSLKRAMEDVQDELRRQAAFAAAVSVTGVAGTAVALSVTPLLRAFPFIRVIFIDPCPPFFPFSYYWIFDAFTRRKQYHKLQYEYALSRFLKDEFESFIGDIEARG